MRQNTNLRRRLRYLAVLALVAPLCAAAPALADTTTADVNGLAPSTSAVDCGNGIQAVTVTPVSGFNPLTATDDQLEANGLSPRPDDAADLATWTAYATAAHKTFGCPTDLPGKHGGAPSVHSAAVLAADTTDTTDLDVDVPVDFITPDDGDDADLGVDASATYGVHTANWSGNIVTGHAYHYAKGRWKVPAAHSPSGDKDYYSSSWVGIGQGNSSSKPLAQAGTESDCLTGCYYTHYSIWWEVYPHNDEQEVSTDVHAGDSIYSSITFVSGKATMHIVDETTDEGGIYTYTGSFTADGTAEWVFERPTVGGYFPHLTSATTTFTDAYAKYGTTTKALGALPHYYATMWNCTSASDSRLAYPGAIASSGTKFIAHWKAYGARSKASSCSPW